MSDSADHGDARPMTTPGLPLTSLPEDDATIEIEEGRHAHPVEVEYRTSNYESALHGLLALGSASQPAGEDGAGDDGADFQSDTSPHVEDPATAAQRGSNEDQSPLPPDAIDSGHQTSQDYLDFQGWYYERCPSSVGVERLSPEEKLHLMKDYRYQVAPWLDIGDRLQCFGCKVLRLATSSSLILAEILALAQASSTGQGIESSEQGSLRDNAFTAGVDQQQDFQYHTVLCALKQILMMVKGVCSDLDSFWIGSPRIGGEVMEMLSPHVEDQTLASSSYWLLQRLCLSIALAEMVPQNLPMSLTHPTPALLSSVLEVRTEPASREATTLCLSAFMFSRSDDVGHVERSYGHNRVEAWTRLLELHQTLYDHRPEESKAVVELYPENGVLAADEFPAILFTSGAAVLENQLYHTGMLILLQNKPRFAVVQQSGSLQMSTLWHARRICGIAMHNDTRESWDPCLLASFLVAARTVTHESQHRAILAAFDRIQRLTGWTVRRHVDSLESQWRLGDEF